MSRARVLADGQGRAAFYAVSHASASRRRSKWRACSLPELSRTRTRHLPLGRFCTDTFGSFLSSTSRTRDAGHYPALFRC